MYQLCHFRGKEFKPLLEPPNGCPSEDTFERVMQAVHPDEIAACLEVYTSQIIKDLSGMHISIDGKKMRGTNPMGHGESSYILSAWVNEHSLSITQEAVEEKTNEITCVPKLLDKLALDGAIVTMDAMGTQVEIAEQVVKKKADLSLCSREISAISLWMLRMLSLHDSHTSDTLSRKRGMDVSIKGATKCSLQRAILPMK